MGVDITSKHDSVAGLSNVLIFVSSPMVFCSSRLIHFLGMRVRMVADS